MPLHLRMKFGDLTSAMTFMARFDGGKAIIKNDNFFYVVDIDDVELTLHIYGGEALADQLEVA